MAYKQNPGRGPMMKTGRNIPETFKGPMAAPDGPGDGIKKKINTLTGTTHRGGAFNSTATGMGSSQPTTDIGKEVVKAATSLTGTTHRGGLFGGRQMAASSSRNTDLLEVAGNAIKSGIKRVQSFFD